MKQKLLFAMLCIASVLGLRAQTDVTSTYLTNADFSATTPIDNHLCGYGKDMGKNGTTYYGFQAVDGWTSVILKAASDEGYEGSAIAGAVFAYGSTQELKGNSKTAPATNPAGGTTGNCFGFFSVWGCGGYYYQEVTLPAGKYTITVPMYNQSGTQANTSYTGFFPTSGTNRTVAVNPTVGQWVNQTVTFTLAAETAGQIRIGYQSTGSGSGANPHLFIDCVKIEFTAIVVKDVLETAIAAAQSVNSRLSDSDLAAAIVAAQGIYDDEDATQDDVNGAAATLNKAAETAMANYINNGGDPTLALANADLSSTEGWTVSQSEGFRDQGNGLIGEYTVRFSPATVDETHLSTEYCFGFEARWSPNYASYNQTTVVLPAGVYQLTYDVENVNASTQSVTYDDLCYVQVCDTKYMSGTTEWMTGKSSWTTHTINAVVNEPAALTISFGYGTGSNNISADVTPALYISHVKLVRQSFLDAAKAEWDDAVAAAAAAKAEASTVTGAELTALNAELAKAEPTTIEGYNEATAALEAATATLIAAKVNYDAIIAEIAYAKTLGVATEDAESALAAADATSEKLIAATQTLKVKEYTEVSAAYPNDVTSLLGTWAAGDYGTTSGQGYIGGETYFDKWNGSAMDLTSSATATLPAGKYVVKVAGRGQTGTTMNLSVKVGEDDAVSTPFLMKGDLGKGIDTAGDANFSEEGTYSNDNNGRGWEYRYITFTTDGSAEVTVTVNGHLNAGTWQSFYAPVLLCDDATYAPIELEIVKAELQILVDEAPAVNPNIGDAAFQLPAAKVEAYSDVLTAAQAAIDNAEATKAIVEQAKSNLEGAIVAYKALEVNAPADGQLFNVILTSAGWNYDQKAMTYIANGRGDAGLYTIQYQEAANQNLAQAFTFTKVDGNNYKMSQIDADGEVRYMCTGKVYGGNDNQIRTTTNADEAMLVTVVPTATAGVYNLFNVAANSNIGSQDIGVFTVGSHNDFNIVETTKPSITINTSAAGWGTVMLPFAQALPSGVKAYSCAEVEGTTLTMVEVDALEANKPYIIEGAWNETVTGDAQGTALECIDGLLTGVYADTDAPVGTYVLQNPGTVAFYVVVGEKQPTVKANHAYLKVSVPEVKAYFLGGNADGIRSIDNGQLTMDNEGAIYNLSGQRVAKTTKGVYVVNGKKVILK